MIEAVLQVAIATKSKNFLASSLVQVIVNHIYSGRIVFSTVSNRSLLADNYKPRAIEIYDSRTAPFLDHYRYVYFDRNINIFLICVLAKTPSSEIRCNPRICQFRASALDIRAVLI